MRTRPCPTENGRRRARAVEASSGGSIDATGLAGARAARLETAARKDRAGRGRLARRSCAIRRPARLTASARPPAGPRYRDGRGSRSSAVAAPSSTMRPAYITAMRSASAATTPRSCVTSTRAMPRLVAQLREQRHHLRLHGDVERSRRFVREQHARARDQRERDGDALAHAAGQLVRIARKRAGRVRQAHASEHGHCGALRIARVDVPGRAMATSTSWSPIRRCGVRLPPASWNTKPMPRAAHDAPRHRHRRAARCRRNAPNPRHGRSPRAGRCRRAGAGSCRSRIRRRSRGARAARARDRCRRRRGAAAARRSPP